MGGMIVGHYALKHPENIERLIFASSIGIMSTPDFAQRDTFVSSMDSCLSRYGANWYSDLMYGSAPNFSPFDLYRAMGDRFGV